MEIKINPGVSGLPVVKVLEQRADYIKSRSEYSNGFIFISEVRAGIINFDPNFNLKQEPDGTYSPDFSSPNTSFKDVL